MAQSISKEVKEKDPLQFASDKPSIEELNRVYTKTKSDLEGFYQQNRKNFDVRHNIWPGQSSDWRKHTRATGDGQPFPWDGASDMPNYLVDCFINYHTDMLMNAFTRANIVATPTEGDDIARASVVSSFLKWLIRTKMVEFPNQMEIGINNLLEKGMMAHYVYWEKVEQKIKQSISLEEMAEQVPELVEMILSEELDEEVAAMLEQTYGISSKKANKMVKDLQKTGMAEIGVNTIQVNRPKIKALASDEDILIPSYVSDIQDSDVVFLVCPFTSMQLREKVKSDGWDAEWVEYAIDNLRGLTKPIEESFFSDRIRNGHFDARETDDETVRVVFAYKKQIDDEGDMGIYVTTFHPDFSGEEGIQGWAKHELLGYQHGLYPVVVTSLENYSSRLIESRSYPEIAEPLQQQLKIETDSSIDRQSIATIPPMTYPMGRPPMAWGPGVRLPVRQQGEYGFADVPAYDGGSTEIRREIERVANEYFGRNGDGVDPQEVAIKQQRLVERVLSHLRSVTEQLFSLYQQYGSDGEYFRVTGVKDIQKFEKGSPRDRYDFALSFDVTTQDPAAVVERVTAITEFANQLDSNGTIDREMLLQRAIDQIAPGWSEDIILPKETASQKMLEEERNALTQIAAGFDLDPPENDAHEIKLQIDQQWAQQPDVSQQLQSDEALATRFSNWVQKRQFQVQQKENAQIGRIGGKPSQFGESESGM